MQTVLAVPLVPATARNASALPDTSSSVVCRVRLSVPTRRLVLLQSGGAGGCPPTPQVPAGISNAAARFGLYASFDHITCLGLNVCVSQLSPSSRKFGSPATDVLKSNAGASVVLSTTQTWLQ